MSMFKEEEKTNPFTSEGGRGQLHVDSLPLFRLNGRLEKSVIRLLLRLTVLLGPSSHSHLVLYPVSI